MTAHLIITVDTEEEGLWGGEYRRRGNSVRNIQSLPRFQAICDAYQIKPTYLVDAPVVADDRASEILAGFLQRGSAELGAHVHPWCNPPLVEEITPRNSFLCNLPETLQREKIAWLTEAIEERFGERPTSFRAGRYGLGIEGAKILQELGYVVDSSVIPFTDYSEQHGPDFRHAPHCPYWIDGQDLCTPGENGTLLEVPVAVGYNRKDFGKADAMYRFAAGRTFSRALHTVGLLDRIGWVRRIKFSPEQSNASRMIELARSFHANKCPAMVMMLHSSTLHPGFSPYVTDENDLSEFYRRLELTIRFCCEQLGMQPSALSEFAARFRRPGSITPDCALEIQCGS